jgi:nucleoid-associated protein YgaU
VLVGTPGVNPIDTNATQPTPETPRYGKRKLREGDTLFGIAKEVYGDGSRWKEIATLNGLSQKSTLRPGVEIKYALAN